MHQTVDTIFANFLKDNISISPASTQFVLAVSGGLDSVVMVKLFAKAKYKFVIAHCNFNLRGEESNRDESFVQQLAKAYNVPFFINRFSTKEYATENKLSIQVAARNLRYQWFNDVRESLQQFTTTEKVFIATAHQANDAIETTLLNFFRGTSIAGLHGILPIQNHIVRPLLPFKRTELLAFAQEHNLEWVEDSSNSSSKYTRNFIRHKILPLAQEIFPSVEDNLLANINRFSGVEQVYNQAIAQLKKKLLQVKGAEVHIPILLLQKQIALDTIVHEIIREYGFSTHQVNEVIKLLHADNGSYISSSTHRIINNRKWVIITPLEPTINAKIILVEKETNAVDYKEGCLQFKHHSKEKFNMQNNSLIAAIHADSIEFPLIVRPYKTGDYFYPLGMNKKKKVSKFLIDQKLSLPQKEKIWVVESNQKIIWVIGYRIDDRFKIKPSTKQVLEIVVSAK